MTNTAKNKMYEAIEKHGDNLNRIFKTDIDNVKLSKLVLRIERVAHKLAEDYCNGKDGLNSDNIDIYTETILKRLDRLINWHDAKVPIFINLDARGYALKIDSDYVRDNNIQIEKDWGGFGLLAPDYRYEYSNRA